MHDDQFAQVASSASSARRPADASAFVQRSADALNTADDIDWQLGVYAPTAVLQSFGDGIFDSLEGHRAVHAALMTEYLWFRSCNGCVAKDLMAASDDTIVASYRASLFLGRKTIHGIEMWEFDDLGQASRHIRYFSIDPKPLRGIRSWLRALLTNPRATGALLQTIAWQHRHM
jgi:hypothetical protein